MRYTKTVLLILLAMLVVAVPTAAAQTPLSDQYLTDESVAASAGTDDVSGTAAVQVRTASPASTDSLPFTGGQIALIAALGLSLVALGVAGVAMSRTRRSSSIV